MKKDQGLFLQRQIPPAVTGIFFNSRNFQFIFYIRLNMLIKIEIKLLNFISIVFISMIHSFQ